MRMYCFTYSTILVVTVKYNCKTICHACTILENHIIIALISYIKQFLFLHQYFTYNFFFVLFFMPETTQTTQTTSATFSFLLGLWFILAPPRSNGHRCSDRSGGDHGLLGHGHSGLFPCFFIHRSGDRGARIIFRALHVEQ